ncbi:MAG: sodium/solute symporter [Phycisphaerales bacterium]|jgi:solute:Na+ symporter, SSS family|nr:sodium/solute symporter [Phycisphaerales bacterium]MBT7171826.1 sodium/solute symporter [Phycisphaerales bacterium]
MLIAETALKGLTGWDLSVVVVYMIAIVGIGCGATWWHKRKAHLHTLGEEQGGYFLAGGTLTWPLIGLALFSTNISTVHLVSLAEKGYTSGLVVGNTEWMAGLCLMILAVFFAPFFLKAKVATLPDFLEKRYSRASRNWLAGVSIFSAVFIHIGFTLYAAAIVLHGLFGLDINTCIVAVAIATGLYTIIGGLLAVVLTETIQTVVLLVGATCLTIFAYDKVGGWEGITQNVDSTQLSMLRETGPGDGGMPWYAALLGYPVIGIWYWCTDQTIVQRVLGAKSENHGRVGPLFAGFIKILPVFIFILPGVMCMAMVKQGVLPELDDPKNTYAFMIEHLLPVGMRGLMAAALLAAAMSTVSGALNSIATLFTYDLYKQFKPNAPEKTLVRVGRITTAVAMALAIVWSIFGIGGGQALFDQFATIICLIAPPITVTFLLGVFWKRASSRGSIITMLVGTAMGAVMFGIYKVHWAAQAAADGKEYWSFCKDCLPPLLQNFWMASFYLAILCAIIHMVTSVIWPDEPSELKMSLVWDHPLDALRGDAWRGIGNYKFLSIALLLTIIGFYIAFA